ncbi:hypothetical protein ACFQ88_16945 [Paenibacillus sp. NPDC056579]|uniref:hypothetical protein n=1 Tax=unclassified Paenibacillus TaxID=185978 RepID=UPI001EF8E16E|nr:hypothetical protein [Paenibacillus sp. H1-7]ULL18081.1 hypothetical protein DVH26_28635 [Paenibacillus sp. H1-7]
MSLGSMITITVAVILLFWYEWPKLKRYSGKEKGAFIAITALGWILSILLLLFPEMPGPTQLVHAIFKPLGQLLEQ